MLSFTANALETETFSESTNDAEADAEVRGVRGSSLLLLEAETSLTGMKTIPAKRLWALPRVTQ